MDINKKESTLFTVILSMWDLYFSGNYTSYQKYDWEMHNSRENNFYL